MSEPLLKVKVAQAIWEAGEAPEAWEALDDAEQAEWIEMANAAMTLIREEIIEPEYERWKEAEELAAMGACANLATRLRGVPFSPILTANS